MKPDQWFTLWITSISVVGGCAAALPSVWLGATLALHGNRKSLRRERALVAAERRLAAVDQAAEQYHHLDVIMSFDGGKAAAKNFNW